MLIDDIEDGGSVLRRPWSAHSMPFERKGGSMHDHQSKFNRVVLKNVRQKCQ